MTIAKQVSSSGRIIKRMEFARNDLRVLAAIRDCGFISINQLHALFPYRRITKHSDITQVYHFTKRLENMGLIEFNYRIVDGKQGALSLTDEGHSMLRLHSYSLETTNADARADAAGIQHFIFMNEAMLKFYKEYSVSFWLTDFLVRAENQLLEDEGFAKDYDAVFQIVCENVPLTVAIEYEHTQRNKTRYQDAFKSYANDPYIQLVIFIVESANWAAPFTEGKKVPGRKLCYMTSAEFLSRPLAKVNATRWNGQAFESITLGRAMQEATANKNREYVVNHLPPK